VTYAGALRKGELLSLKLNRVDASRKTITVTRKGGFEQEIPIGDMAMEYLSNYIEEIRPFFSPRGNHVFVTKFGNSFDNMRGYDLVKRHLRTCGLGKFSPHDLRHAAATHMKNSGCSIKDLAQFLGHRSVNSTAIYARANNTNLRGEIDRMA